MWACRYAYNCVVKNNGLESTNGKIKDLMPLLEFLQVVLCSLDSTYYIMYLSNPNPTSGGKKLVTALNSLEEPSMLQKNIVS